MAYRVRQQVVSAVAWVLALLGAAVSLWGAFQFARPRLVDYATFVAGTSGPLWTASGVLFVYVAYLAQREQLDRQDEAIRANSEELRRQNFERTFFHLLDLRTRIIDGMQIRQADWQFVHQPNTQTTYHDLFGRSALQQLEVNLLSALRSADKTARQWEAQGDRPYDFVQALAEGCDEFYRCWREFLAPLHGNAQFLLSFVESTAESRHSYRRMLRAHLSVEEMVMLVYHAWWLHAKGDSEMRNALKSGGLLAEVDSLPVLDEHREILGAMAAAPPN